MVLNKYHSSFSKIFYVSFFVFIFSACKDTPSEKSIFIYCAAGIKPVIEQVAKTYEQKYKVRVHLQYGGSGTLLSNLRVAQKGDLYLAADKSYITEAKKYQIIRETQPLAYLKPVIATQKNNPKITGIKDIFLKENKIALANPDAASIGRLTKNIFQKMHLWDSLQQKTTVFLPTVNEVAASIKIGAVDAGIIWDATAKQYDNLKAIHTKILDSYVKNITIGVLSFSKKPTQALHFLRFLSAKDQGLQVFKSKGYSPIQGDLWQEKPTLVLFSGGVNRLAVEDCIKTFEARENVQITRVYNGCGILVSQIKSGQQPDAYLSCDASFMTSVSDEFYNITDISKTQIGIATAKNNPKKIQTLEDLTQSNLKVGICNEKLSALGSLTKKLLEQKNLWKAIYKNVRTQTPTADLLVNQLRTNSLDAVIIYQANIAAVQDKILFIPLESEQATALQNFGIHTNTKQKFLLQRFLRHLTSESSKKSFLKNGFQWQYHKN